MGRFNIRHDERVTEYILSSASMDGSTLDMASAYFNITKRYKEAIFTPGHCAQVRVITASPEVYQAKTILPPIINLCPGKRLF